MKQRSSRRALYVFLLIAFVSLTFVTTSVIAYIIRNSGEVKNDFTPAVSVQPEISETFDEDERIVKKDVYFNVGKTGYPVYVRAAIIITWQNEDGTVYFSKPTEDKDYELVWNNTDWWYNDADGYYYYVTTDDKLQEVQSEGSTKVLIKSCVQKEEAPSVGYTLSVEIIVQTVQAIGTTDGNGKDPKTEIPAYKDAWELS